MTAFIQQSFSSGEACQFDWSHEHVELGGVEQVVTVAHVRLCHSHVLFLVAYPRESQAWWPWARVSQLKGSVVGFKFAGVGRPMLTLQRRGAVGTRV